eukprot:365501-Chlamydomonas_euryale.AAC.2
MGSGRQSLSLPGAVMQIASQAISQAKAQARVLVRVLCTAAPPAPPWRQQRTVGLMGSAAAGAATPGRLHSSQCLRINNFTCPLR